MVGEQAGDFEQLTRKISIERGFRCAHYKDKCLRRRVAVRMRARGVHTYGEYVRILDDDAAEFDRLIDALTINVTKLFRNWEVYASIAEHVVPALWHRESEAIRVWSAGCSTGDEAYSLAILFHRYAATRGMLPQIGRVDVLGTDIDRQSLRLAAAGEFDAGDFTDTPDDLRDRYFARQPPFTVARSIRDMVRFERRDLLADPPPVDNGPFDLIVCRNVLIYFDRDTQEQLFETYRRALRPNGFLVLGKVETLLGAARAGFTAVDAPSRIFQRQ
jgi:chemotaxis methyl-accepting protein methylase